MLVNRKDVIKGDPLVHMKMSVAKEATAEPRPVSQSLLLRSLLRSGKESAEPALKKMKKD